MQSVFFLQAIFAVWNYILGHNIFHVCVCLMEVVIVEVWKRPYNWQKYTDLQICFVKHLWILSLQSLGNFIADRKMDPWPWVVI